MGRVLMLSSISLALVGCLSSAPKAPTSWVIEADTGCAVSSVEVIAPYDGVRFVVMRKDGSVAFDGMNVFAARPASLLRGALRSDPAGPVLYVRRLALDCTKEGERRAVAELLAVTRDGNEFLAAASVDASDGNYSRAYGKAFADAVGKLGLRIR